MADISASMVMELRQRTGLGMMECEALTETGGDLAKGRGASAHQERRQGVEGSRRIAAEGVIPAFVVPDGKTGAIVEVNCETDSSPGTTTFARSSPRSPRSSPGTTRRTRLRPALRSFAR